MSSAAQEVIEICSSDSEQDAPKRARVEQDVQGCWGVLSFAWDDGATGYTDICYMRFPCKSAAEDFLKRCAYAALWHAKHVDDFEDHNLTDVLESLKAAHKGRDVDWAALLPVEVSAQLQRAGGFQVPEWWGAVLQQGAVFNWSAQHGAEWELDYEGDQHQQPCNVGSNATVLAACAVLTVKIMALQGLFHYISNNIIIPKNNP